MYAQATIVAEADDRGGTRLTRLRGETPLLLRQTGTDAAGVTVHLVGGAAAPLGGDQLRLDIDVGNGAQLCLRTVAASIALPARSGAPSRVVVTATIATGGSLHWFPEQTVAAAGCHHVAVAEVEVAEGASLLWRDELICGRYNEDPGDATITTAVRYAGRPLLRQTLSVGPKADGWNGPAVLGAAKATGSLLQVQPDAPPRRPTLIGPSAVLTQLTGPATLITATANDANILRAYLSGANNLLA
jgi:urease accessory protein